jgi:hypothetical protein
MPTATLLGARHDELTDARARTTDLGLLMPLKLGLVPKTLSAIGATVDSLYPLGRAKLTDRCLDAISGRASGTVVLQDGHVHAFSMESPKGAGRVKLSTLWVHPHVRERGICRALIAHLCQGWLRLGIVNVYLTVRQGIHEPMLRALSDFGFKLEVVVPDRYGAGRNEVVLSWEPDRAPDDVWLRFHKSVLRVS